MPEPLRTHVHARSAPSAGEESSGWAHVRPLGLPSADLRQTAHVRRTLILETLAKCIHLRHPGINSKLHPLLQTVNAQYAQIHDDKSHPGLQALMRFAGGKANKAASPKARKASTKKGGKKKGGDGEGGDEPAGVFAVLRELFGLIDIEGCASVSKKDVLQALRNLPTSTYMPAWRAVVGAIRATAKNKKRGVSNGTSLNWMLTMAGSAATAAVASQSSVQLASGRSMHAGSVTTVVPFGSVTSFVKKICEFGFT